jgi:hypothetical protein
MFVLLLCGFTVWICVTQALCGYAARQTMTVRLEFLSDRPRRGDRFAGQPGKIAFRPEGG